MTGRRYNHRVDKRRGAAGADVDEHLRRAFHEMAQEELPDRFVQLLAQLRAQSGAAVPVGPAQAATLDDREN